MLNLIHVYTNHLIDCDYPAKPRGCARARASVPSNGRLESDAPVLVAC